MEVKQIYSLIYNIEQEMTGGARFDETPQWIIKEDLSNIADVGTKLLDAASVTAAGEKWRDNFVRSLIDRIGRMVFVERVYNRIYPDVRRDEWEYGSIMTKSRVKRFRAKANPSWSLTPGQVVEQFAFEPPEVLTNFYNSRDAWQIDCSFADVQLREAFTSPREMDRFLSSIRSAVERSMDDKLDGITSRLINALIAEKLNANNGIVDVLTLYNAGRAQADQITADAAITNLDWQRFFAYQVLLYKRRIGVESSWFQIADESGYETATPPDRLRVCLHSDIAEALDVYLQSETYHNELSSIGSYTSIPMWQASGSSSGAYNFATTSEIFAALPSDGTTEVHRNYVIGIMFDWDAIALCNLNRRVTSAYNANGEYWTNYYKVETQGIIDLMENAIVFVLGPGTIT